MYGGGGGVYVILCVLFCGFPLDISDPYGILLVKSALKQFFFEGDICSQKRVIEFVEN